MGWVFFFFFKKGLVTGLVKTVRFFFFFFLGVCGNWAGEAWAFKIFFFFKWQVGLVFLYGLKQVCIKSETRR